MKRKEPQTCAGFYTYCPPKKRIRQGQYPKQDQPEGLEKGQKDSLSPNFEHSKTDEAGIPAELLTALSNLELQRRYLLAKLEAAGYETLLDDNSGFLHSLKEVRGRPSCAPNSGFGYGSQCNISAIISNQKSPVMDPAGSALRDKQRTGVNILKEVLTNPKADSNEQKARVDTQDARVGNPKTGGDNQKVVLDTTVSSSKMRKAFLSTRRNSGNNDGTVVESAGQSIIRRKGAQHSPFARYRKRGSKFQMPFQNIAEQNSEHSVFVRDEPCCSFLRKCADEFPSNVVDQANTQEKVLVRMQETGRSPSMMTSPLNPAILEAEISPPVPLSTPEAFTVPKKASKDGQAPFKKRNIHGICKLKNAVALKTDLPLPSLGIASSTASKTVEPALSPNEVFLEDRESGIIVKDQNLIQVQQPIETGKSPQLSSVGTAPACLGKKCVIERLRWGVQAAKISKNIIETCNRPEFRRIASKSSRAAIPNTSVLPQKSLAELQKPDYAWNMEEPHIGMGVAKMPQPPRGENNDSAMGLKAIMLAEKDRCNMRQSKRENGVPEFVQQHSQVVLLPNASLRQHPCPTINSASSAHTETVNTSDRALMEDRPTNMVQNGRGAGMPPIPCKLWIRKVNERMGMKWTGGFQSAQSHNGKRQRGALLAKGPTQMKTTGSSSTVPILCKLRIRKANERIESQCTDDPHPSQRIQVKLRRRAPRKSFSSHMTADAPDTAMPIPCKIQIREVNLNARMGEQDTERLKPTQCTQELRKRRITRSMMHSIRKSMTCKSFRSNLGVIMYKGEGAAETDPQTLEFHRK